MKAVLVLEDGRKFEGNALGSDGERIGEVIFDTAVVGYQEMLTDPSNAGKILVLTYPLIGNYGCAPKFNESSKVWAQALVIKESSRIFSNWQAKESMPEFLKRNKTFALTGIDTRTLSVHLRQKGQMHGVISTKTSDANELLRKISNWRNIKKESILPSLSVKKPVKAGYPKSKKKIAVLDLGLTNSILKQLESLRVNLDILPYNTASSDILKSRYDALVISGGPEDDPALVSIAKDIKAIIGKMPIFGISTGHQVLGVALGAKLAKLKLGHHGVNYPVHNPVSYKGEITVQNHSWVIEKESFTKIKNVKVTAYNLNDRTIEEIESKKYRLLGVQYIPASPGFGEINPAFIKFMQMLKRS